MAGDAPRLQGVPPFVASAVPHELLLLTGVVLPSRLRCAGCEPTLAISASPQTTSLSLATARAVISP